MAGTRIRITKVIAAATLGDDIEAAMEKLGNAILRRTQLIVPKRTWHLHDSLTKNVSRSGTKVTLTVGSSVKYSVFVENGTSRMAAQPYLRPALLQSKSADLTGSVEPRGPHGVSSGRRKR